MNFNPSDDPSAVSRKKDHIELAFRSRVAERELDARFWYEPLLAAHPQPGSLPTFEFLGKKCRVPIWVSSMTGGTAEAAIINKNLARACGEFGMGMGLGSCRQLLWSDEHLPDFDVRDLIGPDFPLFANLGIAQVEQLLAKNDAARIEDLVKKLRADGLILHVNPMQEALQPEGDRFQKPAIDTIKNLLDKTGLPLIVKEVGQGFGPASMRALLQLPLAAIDFAAAGGTNFALLELLRSDPKRLEMFEKLAAIGHSADEMVDLLNFVSTDLGEKCRVKQVIISGGIGDFLDGFFLIKKSKQRAVYGQASGFLKHARGEYSELKNWVEGQIHGLELAHSFLVPRGKNAFEKGKFFDPNDDTF